MAYTGTAEKKPEREGIEDRDQRLEARFTFDRQGEGSTLAFVAVYREELAKEFLDWFRLKRTPEESPGAGFVRWEGLRFGAELDRAPHQALWWRVRRMMSGEPLQRSRQPKLTPGLDSTQRHSKLMAAVEQLITDHGFPVTGRALPAQRGKLDQPYEERLRQIFAPAEREPGGDG